MDALHDRLTNHAPLILDGGLATTLEAHGHDLDDPLWSARLLMEDPDAIAAVHRKFLAAGADVVIGASYQASLTGFRLRGLSEAEGEALLRLSVDLAVGARDEFWAEPGNRIRRRKPLVAASIGPYGAFLADGSEYVGDYGMSDTGLVAFHEPRWRILADTPADFLACETIPSRAEARVLRDLLAQTPEREAWLSFTCRDGRHLSDGTRLADMVRECATVPGLVAVGVNCTAPEHVASLIAEAQGAASLPVVVYPNRGERYDGVNKEWLAGSTTVDWRDAVRSWCDLGAAAIGGCCRVGPEEIAVAKRVVSGSR